MIAILFQLLILCIICGLIWWILDFIPVANPFNKIGKVIVVVIFVIVLIMLLMPFAGLSAGSPRPLFDFRR